MPGERHPKKDARNTTTNIGGVCGPEATAATASKPTILNSLVP
jgi:hypothetical protein